MQAGWDAVAGAAEEMNRGDAGPALEMCSPDVVMVLSPTPNHPAGAVFYGREALWNAWARCLVGGSAPVTVTPVDLLAGPGHLVLFLEAGLNTLGVPRTERWVLTGVAGDDGLWRELWLQPAD